MNMQAQVGVPASSRPGTQGIEQRLLTAWKRLQTAPGGTLLLAFSGGPDSLSLALALQRIAPLGRFGLLALHIDHRLRDSSGAEAEQAAALADAIALDLDIVTLATHPATLHPGTGVEEAARRERYTVLACHAAEQNAAFVVTAHHQDDQAETVLMHLMRGAGLTGAAGMTSTTELSVPWWQRAGAEQRRLTVWRPWLGERRDQIAWYREAMAPELQPVIDPTNAGDQYLRNRVRHQLMPLLDELRPGSTSAISRFGSLAASDDQVLTDLAREAARRLDRSLGGLKVKELSGVPVPLLRRVLRLEVIENHEGSGLSGERVDALVRAIQAGRGNITVQLGESLHAVIARGLLRFERGAGGE